jgi:hypothetical protein
MRFPNLPLTGKEAIEYSTDSKKGILVLVEYVGPAQPSIIVHVTTQSGYSRRRISDNDLQIRLHAENDETRLL